MAYYDIWDTDTNNVVGHYTNEQDALRLVRDLLDTYGDDYANDLQLGGRDNADRVIHPLGGAELAAMARTVPAKHPKERRIRVILKRPKRAIAANGRSRGWSVHREAISSAKKRDDSREIG